MNKTATPAKAKIPIANIIAVYLIFGVVLTGTALYGIDEFSDWREHGIATTGIVLDKYMDEECQSGGSSSTCFDVFILEYSYQLPDGDDPISNNESHTAKDSVNQTLWHTHPVGSKVNLLYLSLAPQTSSINFAYDLDSKITTWYVVLGFGILLSIIGLFITAKVIVKKS